MQEPHVLDKIEKELLPCESQMCAELCQAKIVVQLISPEKKLKRGNVIVQLPIRSTRNLPNELKPINAIMFILQPPFFVNC